MRRTVLIIALTFSLACSSTPERVDTVHAIAGEALDGASFELSSEKPTLLVFWASWCAVCRKEAPQIAAFGRNRPDVNVVGVSVDRDRAAAQAFASDLALPYRSFFDPDLVIADQLQVSETPTLIALGEGRVLGRANRLDAALKRTLSTR